MNFLFRRFWRRKKTVALMMAEVILVFILLFATTLLYNFTYKWANDPLGFEYENLHGLKILHQPSATLSHDFELIKQTLLNQPNVVNAGFMMSLPFSDKPVYRYNLTAEDLPIELFGNAFVLSEDNNRKRLKVTQHNLADVNALDMLNINVLMGDYRQTDVPFFGGIPTLINQQLVDVRFGKSQPIQKYIQDLQLGSFTRSMVDDLRLQGQYSPPQSLAIGILEPIKNNNYIDFVVDEAHKGNFVVRFSDSPDAAKITEQLNHIFPNWKFELTTLSQLKSNIDAKKQEPFYVLLIVTAFLLLMVILGLAGVMWQEVIKRKGEIGLMRAIGSSKHNIVNNWVGEMVLLVLLSACLCIGALIFLPIVYGHFFSYILFIKTTFIVLLITTLSVIIAGVIPALKAAFIDPANALKS